MPRRMIDPKIWVNLKVGNLLPTSRLLFIGIFSTADDDGRLEADPRFLKATIFPYDEDLTVEIARKLRDDCARVGLIRVYSKNGREYLDIPGWREHQQIRKDRYNPSILPSFEPPNKTMATTAQPDGNQPTTTGRHSIVKSSLVKSNTPLTNVKGARKKRATPQSDPRVREVFDDVKRHFGYPEKTDGKDPIPNYGTEGQAIKRMLTRGFTREEILACWRSKVSQRGGEFVSMKWVNQDIGNFVSGGEPLPTVKPGYRKQDRQAGAQRLPTAEELEKGWKE